MMRRPAARRHVAILTMAILGLGLIPTAPAALAAAPAAPPAAEDSLTTLAGDDTVSPTDFLGAAPVARRGAPSDIPVAGYSQGAHTVDVAVVTPSDSNPPAPLLADAGVRDLVAKTGAYWKAQSNKQVLSLTPNAAIRRYASDYSCNDDPGWLWDEAAKLFGRDGEYYVAAQGHHLLVLVPEGCGGAGVGTIGSFDAAVSTANGGAMWAQLTGPTTLDIVAHEFGHNLGLEHSNTHVCPDPSVIEGIYSKADNTYSDGCSDEEYGDFYDVMSSANSMNWDGTLYTNTRPTALNVTQKERLGALVTGEVQGITLPAGTAIQDTRTTLASTGAASGRRALKATDPLTGQVYYIDFRGGGGADAGSLYETGYMNFLGVDNGVRVLTRRADQTSVVLLNPAPELDAVSSKLYLKPGQSLATRSGGLRVSVQSIAGGLASVTVTLSTPVARLWGADRFSASADISKKNFPVGVEVAYIASGRNFPDALSGAPVAAGKAAPILLVEAGSIPSSIATELARLKPGRIVVLGGSGSVSSAVATKLTSYTAGTVTRLWGADRFSASAAISRANFAVGRPVVYIASGRNFPDALSGAPVAAGKGAPILLVEPGSIPSSIAKELARLKPGKIVVLGGPGSVSGAVATTLKKYTAGTVTRLYGPDRFSASAAISRANFAPGGTVVYIANGRNFPDALSGAPVAAGKRAPILLVEAGSIPASIATELDRLNPASIVVLGGPGSVSNAVAARLSGYVG
ncbi:Putative cell wall-binding protein [Cryobacterium psychrotolerans]|uniref:Putative cell wall-binding protein n=1 Tax=Cryobacterium psychrotolerans TaxID=386301 RepID=A0A1G9CMB4_9MICO|nr:cell wall-binding repeat-containing protein [Cryobacterium psychrotolerans]TFD84243.1 hypothetical protein E3T56_11155 [Cryobacterium psychrotolerans]SDK52605.1 Putative cell wall-binding protein [Cryobacterium psychrotolerans]